MRKIDLTLLCSPTELLVEFYNNNLYLESSSYLPEENFNELLIGLFNCLIDTSCNDILSLLKENYVPEQITKSDIPQFSNFDNCYLGVTTSISESDLNHVDFNKIGYLLRIGPRKEGADKKYGENHSKMASLLGLVSINRVRGIRLTDFGKHHLTLDKTHLNNLKAKLCLRIPLIKNYFCENENESILSQCRNILSESTYKRRISNIRTIISIIKNQLNEELYGTEY